jgi:diguanylate cyclase (GGDEF)-like protein
MSVSIVTLVRLLYSASALALLLMSVVAFGRRRRAPEAFIVSLLCAFGAIYCFGSAQEVAQTRPGMALVWMHVQYLGIPWLPALWVLLARKHYRLNTRIWLLMAVPLITFVGQLTNYFHRLFYSSFQFVPRPPFWIITLHRGPISWLFLTYLYSALVYGTWLYISRFRASSRLLRMQSLLFAFSSLPPMSGYLIYLCGWSPWNLDLGPLLFAVSVVLAYIAVIRYECFDLVPKARSLVFESIRDAALVTDLQHRLVDCNPAARALLPCLANVREGQDVTSVVCESGNLKQVFRDPNHTQETDIRVGEESRRFEVRVLPLRVDEQQFGWAITFADITSRARLLHELRRDAETDELTGVANRRCFVAAIEIECARCIRHGGVFSVLIVDLDHYKAINDRYGHVAGDTVLSAAADRISLCLRRIDLLSRYGGDEFAILLPETGMEGATEAAERIRRAVAKTTVKKAGKSIFLTASIGIAAHDPARSADWMQLLDEADKALYQAKAAGRNRVACWNKDAQQARTLASSA